MKVESQREQRDRVEMERVLKAGNAPLETDQRPNIVRQQFPNESAQKPFNGAFQTMPLPMDDPDNWRFKEWASWHYPVLSVEEQTRMIAAWNESRRQSAHLNQEDSKPINEFTEQQRYAVCQLYAEVKLGGHPNHENSNLAAALETVADMLRTSGVLV